MGIGHIYCNIEVGSAPLNKTERSAIARLNAGEFVVVEDISCLAACRLVTVATLASSVVSQARLRRLFFWTDTLPGKCSAAGIRNSLKRNEKNTRVI